MLRPAKDGSHSSCSEVLAWPPLGCWQANHNICHCVSVKKMKEMEVNYATKNITLDLSLLVVATTAFVLVCSDILVHWKHCKGLFCLENMLEKFHVGIVSWRERPTERYWSEWFEKRSLMKSFSQRFWCLWDKCYSRIQFFSAIAKKWHSDSIISSSKHLQPLTRLLAQNTTAIHPTTDLEIPSLDVLRGSADPLTFWRFDSSSVYTPASWWPWDGWMCWEPVAQFLPSVFELINQRADRAGPYVP